MSRNELDAIRDRYARRATIAADRYSRFSPDVLRRVQERQRGLVSLLGAVGIHALADLDIVEVGCGTGSNLVEFIEFGADPSRLIGNDLLAERIEAAGRVLPAAVRLSTGDACALPLAAGSCDLVYQSTVFSSILDAGLQRTLAAAMWRWLRPGGGVLWYDFTFDNPANPDVRGVPRRRIAELFPEGHISSRRVTLAPPIARRVCRVHPSLYTLCNALPLLRTHLLCWIQKP